MDSSLEGHLVTHRAAADCGATAPCSETGVFVGWGEPGWDQAQKQGLWVVLSDARAQWPGGWGGQRRSPLDVHPCAWRMVGRTHRPLSPGQSGSVVCPHRGSVCTAWGTRSPARELAIGSGWAPGQHELHSWPPAHATTVCGSQFDSAHRLLCTPTPSQPHSCCPRDPVAMTKMLLCSFLSEAFLLKF